MVPLPSFNLIEIFGVGTGCAGGGGDALGGALGGFNLIIALGAGAVELFDMADTGVGSGGGENDGLRGDGEAAFLRPALRTKRGPGACGGGVGTEAAGSGCGGASFEALTCKCGHAMGYNLTRVSLFGLMMNFSFPWRD